LQADVILEAEHARTLEVATELSELARELQQEMSETGARVFSIDALRKAERIESLAKDVQKRLKRN
jgi:hypothetical protein